MTMFNYGTGETPEQEAARKKRQNQSMLTPGTSPSAVSSGLLEQQQSFIPQGTFEPNPDVLQNIVANRTQEVLPENRQVDIGGQTVVGGTAPNFDAAGISNMATGRGTGTITNPPGPNSLEMIAGGAMMGADAIGNFASNIGSGIQSGASALGNIVNPPPVPTEGAGFGRGQGFEGLDGLYTNRPGFEGGPTVTISDEAGRVTYNPAPGESLGDEGSSIGDVLEFIKDSGTYKEIQRNAGTPILKNIIDDIKDPNTGSTEESLEDGVETGKDGNSAAFFDNPKLASLESQIDGLNTGIGVQTSEALTDAYSSGKGAIESAGGDTVFLNKFFKQVSQPLKFNENGSPYLPEFPGELLQQLTRMVPQQVENPAYLALIASGAPIPDDVSPTITQEVPVIDPAGEILLDFYNEYVGNALLMAREAQNQKNQLAVQEIQSNPFGLTAVDQKEIENIRANPFNLTAEQRLSLERQGLSALEFTELELEKQRIGARPNLIQSISGFFQPGTVAALGGTANVEGLLSRLGAFDGVREIMPAVQQTLGTGSEMQAQPLAQNYLDSLIGRVPDDVLNSLENGIPLTAARLAQLETENPTALQIYLGNQARQGTSAEGAVLEGLSRQPGDMNRNASTIGANVV